jgi:integrase
MKKRKSKRGVREGTIRERPDGRWEGRVLLGYQRGKRVRPSVYGSTREEVQDKLRKAIEDAKAGIGLTPTNKQTVGQFLDDWLEDVVKKAVRPKTHHSYAQLIRLHINPELGRIQLSKLTPRRVQRLFNEKLDSDLAPRTVQYIRAVLRRALEHAVKWDLVTRNVVKLTEPPRAVHHEITPLTPQQAKKLLKTLSGHRLEALITVAAAMGLRQGEALGLKWANIDFKAKQLRVTHALQYLGGEFSLVEPKTARSRRTVSIPDVVLIKLKRHRTRQQKERLRAGGEWEDWGLVFTTRLGRPLEGSRVTRDFKLLLKQAGLPPQRFHDLRHACASFLLAQGVSARQVMELLGHSQISLTLNTYSHILPSLQTEVAEKMDALLG